MPRRAIARRLACRPRRVASAGQTVDVVEVRCPYLVGREGELTTVRDRLNAACAGSGGAVFLSGEPGVGKTRLAREAAAYARADRAVVLSGRAVPLSSEAAYRPLAEALAQALRDGGPPDSPALAPWLPALRVMLPALGPETRGTEATAHTCGEALVQLLRWVRGARPLVLTLEDLHWADPDTLEVVDYLADNLSDEPVLCLATLRTEPETTAAELARRVHQRGTGTHLALRPLRADAVSEMVRATRPEAPTDLVARVQATADGVPLLVEELLATDGVPASVGEAVRTRVAGLDDDDRSVLHAAAVLGRDFDWQLLPAVTGLPVERVTAALERMMAAMLVSVDGDGFRFRHALTREAVVTSLLPPRRRALARTALAALDAAGSDHADLALQAGDRVRAGFLLVRSGPLCAVARSARP